MEVCGAHFFDVVNQFTNLYISYRGRYVVALNGSVFIPHVGQECKRLENKAIIAHLNQRYAIGVFAGFSGSKFLCFDIDLDDLTVVRKVMDGLCEFGIPEDYIFVSTSGGKGYHVEVFFSDLVYTNLLYDLYMFVIAQKQLDHKKVEFRPTFGQAIKLPLSKHHKTGNICWYLDRHSFEPIKDIGYVMNIRQMDRDAVEQLIQDKAKKKMFWHEDCHTVGHAHLLPPNPDNLALETDELPMMTGPGMRNSMMVSIGVHERYKGT